MMANGLKQCQNLNQPDTNSINLFLFPYNVAVSPPSPAISTTLCGRERVPHRSSWSSEECLAATYTLDYTSTLPASLHSASHLHSLLFRRTKINRRFVILPQQHSELQLTAHAVTPHGLMQPRKSLSKQILLFESDFDSSACHCWY